MTLREGSETIIDQCLNIQEDEKVVVIHNGNIEDLVESVTDCLDDMKIDNEVYEYPEPETSGMEPPQWVSEAMKGSDVFIIATNKSISHTRPRREANEEGARGVGMSGINREMWLGGLQADYKEVERITKEALKKSEGVEEIKVQTDRGTEITFEVNSEYFQPDTGRVLEKGEYSNLPAGEIFTGPLSAEGKLVIEENIFGTEEYLGNILRIEEGKVVSIENAPEDSNILEKVNSVEGADNVAEFGFGTNPEAFLVGHPLQDEKNTWDNPCGTRR